MCQLLSINLEKIYDEKNNNINTELLKEIIYVGIRILDDIIDVNEYVLPQFEKKLLGNRKIGLGVTGFANLLIKLGIKYDSEECLQFIDQLFGFIKQEAEKYDEQLAEEKGVFPNWKDSVFAKKGIKRRNATITTQAPTGSVSTILGTQSYGIEPLFAIGYKRRIINGEINEINELFKQMLHEEINNEQEEQKIIEECCKHGTANLSCVPQKLKELFRCANDISPEWHARVLAQIQKYIDNAVSKTVNMPENATKEDVKQVYELAFRLGCKGITMYRNNSRQNQTFQIGNNKKDNKLNRGDWKQIAEDTVYYKRKLTIGCGKLKLFIGYSEKEKTIQDLYVVRSGQGGCERTLQGMVIAMSGMLRLGGNIFNIEKAFEGIGGCNSFVSKRAKGQKLSTGSNCGTAILNEIKKFLKEHGSHSFNGLHISSKALVDEEITNHYNEIKKYNNDMKNILKEEVNNKCPVCGNQLQLVEGCQSCSCGYSKCS